MADGVIVTQQSKDIARTGIYFQAEALIPGVKEFNGTVSAALEDLGLTAFIENEIAVKAADIEYNNMIVRILNKETFNGAYAHLA